jgi:probable phosphoglycerate mutase
MVATRITAVRHGETDWNAQTRIQGQIDIPLNARGQWQAEQVGRALSQDDLARIYSSDLSRAHSTALAIARQCGSAGGLQVTSHPGLRERGFGVFEGHTYASIETRWPDGHRRWKQRDPDFAPEGGETPLQVLERVRNTIDTLAAQHLGQHIVVVAHGGVLDMLYRLATRQAVNASRTWELGNATINRLLWTANGLTLVGWADSQHLQTGEDGDTNPITAD